MERDPSVIHAVHSEDLEDFLAKLGLLDDFNAGKIQCSSCGTVVTKDNLAFIFPSQGQVKFLCSAASCAPAKSRG
jgi:hypothetical protein